MVNFYFQNEDDLKIFEESQTSAFQEFQTSTFQESQTSIFQESQVSMFQQSLASSTQNNEASTVPALDLQHTTSTMPRSVKVSKNRSKDITRAIDELKQIQQLINNDVVPPNQYDIFGSSVAAQLKNLPCDKALIAQSKIQAILTDIAIENLYSNHDTDYH